MANDKKPELPPFAEFVNSNADLFGAIIVILFASCRRNSAAAAGPIPPSTPSFFPFFLYAAPP